MYKLILITGLPGSGKTTLGDMLHCFFKEKCVPSVRIEGKDLRDVFDVRGYGREDVGYLVDRSSIVLDVLLKSTNVILTAVLPFDDMRTKLVSRRGYLIYLECELEDLVKRSEKYALSEEGLVSLPGVDVPFEEPRTPDLVLKTCKEDPKTSLKKMVEFLSSKGVIA